MAAVLKPWRAVKRKAAATRAGSAVRALSSLRGPLGFDAVEPAEAGIAYRPATARGKPARRAVADIYLPEGAAAATPSVVLVHGGGFAVGHRKMKPIKYIAANLVDAGVAVCAIDYRMMFRGGRLGEAVADVEAAVDWWAQRSEVYGCDASQINLCGLSAGATLALLSAPVTERQVRGYVSIFALYDLSALEDPAGRAMARIVVGRGGAERRRACSPIGAPHINRPVFMLHGTDDAVVEIHQARAFAERRQAAGGALRFSEYAGAEHAFFNYPDSENTQRAMRDIVDFVGGA